MQSTTVFCSFLLFSFLALQFSPPCAAASQPNPVLDMTGKIVRQGIDYYIKPIRQDLGLGLNLASVGNHTCPLSVVQKEPYDGGTPVTFFPVNPKKGVIREWTDMNVEFPKGYSFVEALDACPGYSFVWTLDGYKPLSSETHYVVNGGVKGNPGRDTIKNWFKVAKSGEGYRFVFCPSVCEYCEVICKNVGIVVEDGQRRLALTDDPLELKFERV
ncbi:miraculin-like [Ipomoea triloba]|uniref:miraculin-like n=1 Tax=Ipomoea triloba TaxID=35885 RepID=UPI00125D806C|nr:miraculin-like [Ipomoea triloba]